MTGKTHNSVGILSSLVITQPRNIKEILICIGAASVGSLICDVDVTRSTAKNKLNHIIGIMVITVAIVISLECFFKLGLLEYIKQKESLFNAVWGAILFVGICIVGEKTPHRSFMHSVIGVFSLTLAVYMLSPIFVFPFVVAMISHIIIDLFNKKKVKLLYPLKSGVAFNLCKSNGHVNRILFLASNIGIIVYGTLALIVK